MYYDDRCQNKIDRCINNHAPLCINLFFIIIILDGDDFIFPQGGLMVPFMSGAAVGTEACDSITIEADTGLDNDRDFVVSIQTNADLYTVESPSDTTITILDDDREFATMIKKYFCHNNIQVHE